MKKRHNPGLKPPGRSFLATRHFLSLAESGDPDCDPILRQVVPTQQEEVAGTAFVQDPLSEKKFSPLPRLVRRYEDRALILCTNKCFIHCRFCFRKRLWSQPPWTIGRREFAKIAEFIGRDHKIKEAILSGGDSLCLDDGWLLEMIGRLDSIGSLDVIRLATRALSAEPSRFSAGFVRRLRKHSGKLWLMSHFNHRAELSDLAKIAIGRLVDSGIPVLNQTVLLKGVNDDVGTLSSLFRALVAVKVRPHYLFHVDPAEGNSGFVTGVDKALELVAGLRRRLSSICVPSFALDLPSGGGKIVLSPELRRASGEYCDYEGRTFRYF